MRMWTVYFELQFFVQGLADISRGAWTGGQISCD